MSKKISKVSQNKVNPDVFVKMLILISDCTKNRNILRNKNKLSTYEAIVHECKFVTDTDRCDAVANIFDCINDSARKRGMEEIL